MIIQNVPYIDDKEQRYASCQGPPTVMMVFEFFFPDKKMTFLELYKELNYTAGTWFFETYIARFFHRLGIPVKYYGTQKLTKITPEIFKRISGLDFSKQEDRDKFGIDTYDSAVEYVLSNDLFEKKEISLNFIKNQLGSKKLVIATINRNKLIGKEGYKGHFILIIGFDENNFICNDSYLGENLKITYDKFKEAFYNSSNESDITVVG